MIRTRHVCPNRNTCAPPHNLQRGTDYGNVLYALLLTPQRLSRDTEEKERETVALLHACPRLRCLRRLPLPVLYSHFPEFFLGDVENVARSAEELLASVFDPRRSASGVVLVILLWLATLRQLAGMMATGRVETKSI